MARRRGNREALLEAAVACIQDRGYGRTTARDLVDASGTNLGAIGYHFGSKEGLLNEALAECGRRWLEQIAIVAAEPADGATDHWQQVIAASHRAVLHGRPVAVGYLEAWTQAQRSPELRQQLAAHYREFRAAAAAIATPGGGGGDPEGLAAVLVAVADGLIVQWLLDPDALPDPERLARVLMPLVSSA
ncbi:TetR/AcrR family transcriptional regulator [Mycobacterium sp. DL440]|uniref:TetR/AcrR family transcriptional regulator n=1 Tax=Mycobacterium sp. DL440 TaxID=2675523 RepID=UPI001422C4B9|nr:TetR/AcrR family transcriptional regulator [Mycobacterium sp. DL440]